MKEAVRNCSFLSSSSHEGRGQLWGLLPGVCVCNWRFCSVQLEIAGNGNFSYVFFGHDK